MSIYTNAPSPIEPVLVDILRKHESKLNDLIHDLKVAGYNPGFELYQHNCLKFFVSGELIVIGNPDYSEHVKGKLARLEYLEGKISELS